MTGRMHGSYGTNQGGLGENSPLSSLSVAKSVQGCMPVQKRKPWLGALEWLGTAGWVPVPSRIRL